MTLKFVEFRRIVFPLYGNKRVVPYGEIAAMDELGNIRVLKFGKCDSQGRPYVTCDRRRYYYRLSGGAAAPRFEFIEK